MAASRGMYGLLRGNNCTFVGTPAYFSGGPPAFTFPFPCPRLDTSLARASATIFGTLFAAVAIVLAAVVILSRKTLRFDPFCALLATFSVALCRAAFFLADPYHIHERMPALLTGALFGVAFPLRNVATCMCFYSLYSLVSRTEQAMGGTKKWDPTKLRKVIAAMNVLQFLIQLFADVLRGGGYTWYLLNICRMWFVGWGIAIALGFSLWTLRLWRIEAQSASRSLQRLHIGFLLYSLFGLLTCFTSTFYLTQPVISLDALMVLYDVDTTVELGQCCAATLLFGTPPIQRLVAEQVSGRTRLDSTELTARSQTSV